jgi:hypothetical protein
MSAVTITLEDNEQSALLQLIDVALRQSGLGALDVAAHFKVKLDAAVKAADTNEIIVSDLSEEKTS